MPDAGNSVCSLLKMVSSAFPPEAMGTTPEVTILYQKLWELVHMQLAFIAAPQAPGEDNSASMVSFVLFVIKSLSKVHKNLVDPFSLVRVLRCLAQDIGLSGGTCSRQVLVLAPII